MTVPFSKKIQQEAWERQKQKCASCGLQAKALGNLGASQHLFGEGVQAHHVVPHKMFTQKTPAFNGPNIEQNCVILCRACHMNSHQGARWGDVSIYADISEPITLKKIAAIAKLYPYYSGRR